MKGIIHSLITLILAQGFGAHAELCRYTVNHSADLSGLRAL